MISLLRRTSDRVVLEGKARMAMLSRGQSRECPLCSWTGERFLPFGREAKRRDDALCPRCRSIERQRLAYALLRDCLGDGQRTLHMAPEPPVSKWLQSISGQYLSGDLEATRAMRVLDLTRLDLPDLAFTLVYCSHVLEHVSDDRAAMAEIRRVLEPGGVAIVMVPIAGDETDEDPAVCDPEERLLRFGQRDHVRLYGLDIVDRLNHAGLSVELLAADDLAAAEVERCRLSYSTTNQVFVCR